MSDVQIENVAAVERLKFSCPEGGGLVVLTGENGAGKSKSLEAIDAILSGGDPKGLQARDRTRGGTVDAFGVTIRVGQSRHRTLGELTVASLDDRLSIAELVDPGYKDPAAADRHRLKALLRVCGAEADLNLFGELLGDGEDLRPLLSPETLAETDLVALAQRIKRDLEAAARVNEDRETAERSEAAALVDSIRDVNLGAPADVEQAQQALDAARREEQELEFRRKSAAAADERYREAQRSLSEAESAYTGPSADAARQALSEAEQREQESRDEVFRLQKALDAAHQRLKTTAELASRASDVLSRAEHHESLIAGWRATIERGQVAEMPAESQLLAARERVERAKSAVANAGVVARAIGQRARATILQQEADRHNSRAFQLRQAARATDEVLTQVVTSMGGSIRVGQDDKGNARLLVTHPKRGEIFFSELSAGERWSLALPIAIAAVGEGGVFTIRQEAWEGLSPSNRARIIDALRGSGVTAITAQAADGPIRAETFGVEGGDA